MADEKKYSAREAALAILAKAEEVLKKSELGKALNYADGKPAPSTDFPRIAMSEDMGKAEAKSGAQHAAEGAKRQSEIARREIAENKGPRAGNLGASLKRQQMGKAENPDEKQDAQLGEDVEHLCEDHMMENKDAERKEGHKWWLNPIV